MGKVLGEDVRLREAWAWSMYDFANSGFTTVVITAVFNAFFVSTIAGKAPWATFAWTAALSVSYLAVLLTAPVVGAWADAHAIKKRLLLITTIGCVLFTAALAWTGPGTVALAIGLIIVANFFFSTGENLIAAFLPELAKSEALGRVSGWGWAFGYLGGLVALGLSLAYILLWAQKHDEPATHYVPVAMLITAGLFAVCCIPTFTILKERAVPQRHTENPFARLRRTISEAARFRDLRRFLACILFYQAGIQAVVALAAIYATEAMGFTFVDTIILILVVNLTAACGAAGFGYFQDWVGHLRAMQIILACWILVIAGAYLATSTVTFWIVANMAGICMGSAQAAGRAIIGYLSPMHRVAEFFGLWGLAFKTASIFGPLTYGIVTWVFAGNHRLGILAVGVYFVIGLVLLRSIDIARGRSAALAAS